MLSIGGGLGALASASCCLLPFALFTLGVGGAWIGRLTALAPYQPVFLALTLLSLGTGFVLVYRSRPAACDAGSYCERPAFRTTVAAALWLATALVVAALVFPYAVRLFFST